MPNLSGETRHFIIELDAAVEAHLGWTRRVMRCAVLRASPGDDVLASEAHMLCRFGHWIASQRSHFEKLNARKTQQLEAVHQTMHDAIRALCVNILAGQPGASADLETFEQSQSELIGLMAWFKTQFLAEAMCNDPLTGLPLRFGIEDEFMQAQKVVRREGTQLYLAMIDVDHFKNINDQYGHAVGDRALQHLTRSLSSALRPNEPLFRFGGEEFLLMMQCPSPEAATIAAKRIVEQVRNTPLPLDSSAEPIRMTITLGLTQAQNGEFIDEVIDRADQALYAGKRGGRDRYVMLNA
ncbi:MAG: diguanylate cyclase [Gammaproteobacteria bacterium]|nr:diguanylate cyclase [Gammaproteobacteria bacterium]MBU4500204.1 diguanylate cyclase [Gammaproteobacteria bacterium]